MSFFQSGLFVFCKTSGGFKRMAFSKFKLEKKENGFLCGSSVLFHTLSCVFLYQYHAVFIPTCLWYNLKSGVVDTSSQWRVQTFFYYSENFGLFWILYVSIWNLRFYFQFLYRIALEIWWWLYWFSKLYLVGGHFYKINLTNPQ